MKKGPADTKPAPVPTPTPTPTQTADAPKAKAEAELAPEDASPEAILLAKRGLKKEGLFYVIATEYQVAEGYHKLVPYWKVTAGAWGDLTQAVEIELYLQGLDDTRINLQSFINDLNLQLANIPNNPATKPARDALQQQKQVADANLRETNRLFAIAIKRRPAPGQIDRLRGIFLAKREEFYEESNKLKPVFDKVMQEYQELKKDKEVENAIKTLKEQTKAPVSIGPSTHCRKAFSQIKECQKMLSLDPDAYRRGKKPRLKQNPKGKSQSMPSGKMNDRG